MKRTLFISGPDLSGVTVAPPKFLGEGNIMLLNDGRCLVFPKGSWDHETMPSLDTALDLFRDESGKFTFPEKP